jgi:peptide chain release factor subunit 3
MSNNYNSWEEEAAQDEHLAQQTGQMNLGNNQHQQQQQQGGFRPAVSSFTPGASAFTPGAAAFNPGQAYGGYSQPYNNQYAQYQQPYGGGYGGVYGQQQGGYYSKLILFNFWRRSQALTCFRPAVPGLSRATPRPATTVRLPTARPESAAAHPCPCLCLCGAPSLQTCAKDSLDRCHRSC